MHKAVSHALIVVLLLGALLAPGAGAPGAQAQAAGLRLPPISFEGFGIGAHFNDPVYPPDQQPPATPWAERLRADVFDRLYFPGQTAQLALTLTNTTDAAITINGTVAVAELSEELLPNGGVKIVPGAILKSVPVASRTLGPNGQDTIRFDFAASRNGVFGVYAQLSSGATSATRWLGNLGWAFPPHPGFKPDSFFMGDLRSTGDAGRDLEIATLRKLGVKWIRGGEDVATVRPTPAVWDWSVIDPAIDRLRRNEMYMIYLGGGVAPWMRNGKLLAGRDISPTPDHYGEWATYWYQLIKRHGDIIRAINVWNEPWEDFGISGWMGTGLHYRNLSRYAMQGVKLADPTVLVGGNDSHDNINDNLISDPDWPNIFDLATFHGGGNPAYFHIQRQIGNLPLWGTEDWYTAQAPRTVQHALIGLASGAKKVNQVVVGNFFSGNADAGGYYDPGPDPEQFSPQPNAIGFSALTHFLEDTTFLEEPHPDRLPYTTIFKGQGRYVAAMYGVPVEIATYPFWQIDTPGTMRLPDPRRGVTAYDQFGNPYPRAADGSYQLPFGYAPVYLEASTLDALHAAIDGLMVQGTKPVQIKLDDLTRPLGQPQPLRVTLTNVLPQPISGTLQIHGPEGWQFASATVDLRALPPGQSREFRFELVRATPNDTNSYPIQVTVTTPYGTAQWSEHIEAHVIARGTPALAGDVRGDMARLGVTPIHVGTATDPVSGTVGLAYDDRNLYVLAEVNDPTESYPVDQLRGQFYATYPEGSVYTLHPQWLMYGDHLQLAINSRDNVDDYLYPRDSALHERYPKYETDYLFSFYRTQQGTTQVWQHRAPGTDWRHRYPFSPPTQGEVPGATAVVTRTGDVLRYEVALPWSAVPDLRWRTDTRLAFKLADGWGGPISSQGRSSSKRDQSTFHPRWMEGWSADTRWGFAQGREGPSPWQRPASDANLGDGTGLQGEYFDNADLTNRKVVRKDAQINFDWQLGSPNTHVMSNTFAADPASVIISDTFSVRWTGQVLPRFTEEYVFGVLSDGGVRLWVDGRLIIDAWNDRSLAKRSARIALQGGRKYDLKLEYTHNTGHAFVRLGWVSPHQPSQVIPPRQFYPPPGCCSTAIVPMPPARIWASAGPTSAELSWELSAGATSYTLKRGASPGGPFTTLAANLRLPRYTDTGLVTGQPYYYVVSASSPAGSSGDSAPVRVLPTTVQIVEAEDTTVHPPACISFDSFASRGRNVGCTEFGPGAGITAGGIDGGTGGPRTLAIRYATGSEQATKTLTVNNTISSTLVFSGTGGYGGSDNVYGIVTTPLTLQPGAGNTIAITHQPGNNGGVVLDVLYISPPDTQAPTAPGNLRLQGKTNTTLSLAWDEGVDNVGIIRYEVYSGTAVLAATDGFPAATVTGLTPGTSYTLVVRARDAVGNLSPASAPLIATTDPTPVDLRAAPQSGKVLLTWRGGTDGITYNVKRSDTPGGPYATIATGVIGTSYTDTSVAENHTYYYVVSAVTAAGESANSNEAKVRLLFGAWASADIGTPELAGDVDYRDGTFTVRGAGTDIWNDSDQFHYVYQPLSGDGEIVARVVSMEDTDYWAKAGVMIRESLAANSRHAFVAAANQAGARFQWRSETGGFSGDRALQEGLGRPYWVRLVRQGNTFTGSISLDGVNWTQTTSETISMGQEVFVGLAVTSHNPSRINTSVFDNVTVIP